MKKIIILLFLAVIFNFSYSQDFSKLESYSLEQVEDYKLAEKQVLVCANYLFNTPLEKSNLNRLSAIQFIMKWMIGTPDYMFDLGEKAMNLTKGNSDLLGLYMAAMSKTVLDSGEKLNSDQIYEGSEELMIAYCSDKNNNMKPSKVMKKIIKSRKE